MEQPPTTHEETDLSPIIDSVLEKERDEELAAFRRALEAAEKRRLIEMAIENLYPGEKIQIMGADRVGDELSVRFKRGEVKGVIRVKR